MNLNVKWEPKISLAEFAASMPQDDRINLPCLCGENMCRGWAAIRPDLFDLMQHMSDFAQQASEILSTGDSRT